MLTTSGKIWVQAVALTTVVMALVAAFLGLFHFGFGGIIDVPSNDATDCVTICECVVDDERQSAVAMIRSADMNVSGGRRTFLIGLELSQPFTSFALPAQVLEPIAIAAGPDGQLVVAAIDGGVYSVNLKRPGEAPVLITRHEKPPFQLMCSPDGRWLIMVGATQFCVWDLPAGELKWDRAGSDILSAAFVPNSDLIVCGMEDGSVTELSLETGADRRRLSRHQSPVMSVTVSPQGDRVAAYSHDGESRVIDRLTGESIWQFCASKYAVPLLKFSPNGRRLVTGSLIERQWALQVWDLGNPNRSSDLKGHDRPVRGAEFLPNNELLTWSIDGTLRRWSLNTGGLLQVISLARTTGFGNEDRSNPAVAS